MKKIIRELVEKLNQSHIACGWYYPNKQVLSINGHKQIKGDYNILKELKTLLK